MKNNNLATAVFANGCFWCTEAVFGKIKGVVSVLPGYTGGTTKNPDYTDVSTGTTGHAEAIKIEYDPTVISYKELLEVFFYTHDPTTPNRQGNDIGTQYRSAIFYKTVDEKNEAEKFIKELTEAKSYSDPIVTEITPLDVFYEAENYHHDYYEHHKDQPYCKIVIAPKIEKIQHLFAKLLK
ncbi:MAG TPA: peptide-methionine (S)-S-oxide reductase MsrA [Candidatus Paceibacterota bacterium]|nr:peptide-methionine (S)-S-oxide reductase MsrA [Candidatus Paceibacterota bacterium]